METLTVAGGCFWCTEAVFSQIKGVEKVTPGYSGGNVNNPSYKEVSTGVTGHAESLQIVFDPKVISLDQLFYIFFKLHDPTTLNRQGADIGTQYRSAIFYKDEGQRKAAEKAGGRRMKNFLDLLGKRLQSGRSLFDDLPQDVFFKADEFFDVSTEPDTEA